MLPPTPTEQEIETFVTLMGHFGRQTGFPGLRVTVAGPDALAAAAPTPTSSSSAPATISPASTSSATHLPVSLAQRADSGARHAGLLRPPLHHAWWKLRSNEHTESGDLTAGGTPDAVIEGIESPYDLGGSRSIVAIHLRDANAFEPFMDTFLMCSSPATSPAPSAVLHGTQFQSFRIGSEVYHVGVLPWWTRLTLWFMQVPWLVAVVVVDSGVPAGHLDPAMAARAEPGRA